MFRKAMWLLIAGITMTFVACVTINIYFPAEKVESVASDIVDEIRDRQPTENNQDTQKNQSGLWKSIQFAFVPASVWAQDATTVSNPTIRALKDKMRTRFGQLKPFYASGALSEENNGYLKVANTSGMSLKDKRDVTRLVSAENKDREALYAEVAKALDIDASQIQQIAEIFAKEWQKAIN
jgi:hypothetical protein